VVLEQPSEVVLYLRWVLGFLLILGSGWGFLVLVAIVARSFLPTMALSTAAQIAAIPSFLLFFFLEKNLWLSRFMGLRVGPHSTRIGETLFFWLLGPIALLIRSSAVAETPRSRTQEPVPTDTIREVLETVVFVVVLVLLLKGFAAEAFVIPTGSMATTLLGYNKEMTCEQCGHTFVVNCSKELDEEEAERRKVTGCTCPNCRFHFPIPEDTSWSSGDRVLVAKFLFDSGLASPRRHQVVVFKYPERPIKKHVPTNYIKRLIGLPGETILIYYGKLYVIKGIDYRNEVLPEKDTDLWKPQYMYMKQYSAEDGSEGDDLIRRLRRKLGGLGPNVKIEMIRKAPEVLLALRRLVYDNDHQAQDLRDALPPRWAGEDGWKAAGPRGFRFGGRDNHRLHWLRYRHILRPPDRPVEPDDRQRPPELITDFMGYNTYDTDSPDQPSHTPPSNWVGDLILEARVTVEQAEGEMCLELSKGVDRFQASWELATGKCTLYRITGKGRTALGSHSTRLSKPGEYQVRFANVDERLTVWVDRTLPFEDGVAYEAPTRRGPTDNDLEPASIGVQGGKVRVEALKLWRDTYYTTQPSNINQGSGPDAPTPARPEALTEKVSWENNWYRAPGTWVFARDDKGQVQLTGPELEEAEKVLRNWYERYWKTPSKWGNQRRLPALSMYVQPGHYLCLGDNSPESSDGRMWGTVPERLMLGRALMVYFPFSRAGRIR
jgi:signal peptidase I